MSVVMTCMLTVAHENQWYGLSGPNSRWQIKECESRFSI